MSGTGQALMQQGLAALRQGDGAAAEAAFLQAMAGGQQDASVCLALAFACVNQGKAEAALAAVDDALVREPRNLRALLFKADHLDRMGQSRLALSFYEGALRVAAGLRDIPQDVMQGLQRAQAASDQSAREYADYLMDALQTRGYSAAQNSRFAESLDIALGRRSVQLQQPTRYYFPGLPQRYFYEREEFAWVAALEAQTDVIRGELLALMQEAGHFSPYLEGDGHGPQLNDRSNVGNMEWSAHYLWRNGAPVADNLARCPRTAAALEAVPMPMVAGQTPSALFSRLAPGAVIPPHHGVLNTRLICHLPLIVPQDCGQLRVGNEARQWREGELLIFDDSMEHEANNPSQRDRVVLLFDIWRPELSEEERHWVSELLLAVNSYTEN
ncbi:aspartyl/asparaginyl beta-hydroxylase domain-containing protein [Parahaliea mediterranea]|uniref:aspartyl/asparaginyl beta-hydroxylase domain-containing protein n=1 Tax=Parahaliea mediterranea TaxID=651086 RepID=UPI0013007BD9|nr:aspartyl/asparaginyl beta-hydroxylase domain-containing protein [Parahaliea mediterranea]